ncbi:DUF1194 domain-containing protein [Pseudooceanicola sp. MF1-13]|uniref:DUF1194 domain-containing protein n=1 Tax=Pseudooceanicola sp. MF1-13 TaxID=3379095 RepID=UPI0038919D6C
MVRSLIFAAVMAIAPAAPALAQLEPYDPNSIEVDVELLLLVDVSRSMTPNELEIQRRGYAEALVSPEVLKAINGGMIGHVAIAYVEWAGSYSQRVIQEWAVIRTYEDAQNFADSIAMNSTGGMRRTSISSALSVGAVYFRDNGFTGLRRVIDVSGDGPNNDGAPVLAARDQVVSQGITINGLPLMTREGMGGMWTIENLDAYYRDCVIGGPGAFVVPVLDWSEFAAAVRKKLVLEIAGDTPPPAPFAIQTEPERIIPTQGATDCLIGEKIWERYRQNWEP